MVTPWARVEPVVYLTRENITEEICASWDALRPRTVVVVGIPGLIAQSVRMPSSVAFVDMSELPDPVQSSPCVLDNWTRLNYALVVQRDIFYRLFEGNKVTSLRTPRHPTYRVLYRVFGRLKFLRVEHGKGPGIFAFPAGYADSLVWHGNRLTLVEFHDVTDFNYYDLDALSRSWDLKSLSFNKVTFCDGLAGSHTRPLLHKFRALSRLEFTDCDSVPLHVFFELVDCSPRLSSLSIIGNGKWISRAHLSRLAIEDRLERLEVESDTLTDADLQDLYRMGKLHRVDLRGCMGVSWEGIGYIFRCEQPLEVVLPVTFDVIPWNAQVPPNITLLPQIVRLPRRSDRIRKQINAD